MAKRVAVKVNEGRLDLDVTIVVRSAQLKITELKEFNRLINDFLSTLDRELSIVAEDILVQRDFDRTLVTITSKLQAQ